MSKSARKAVHGLLKKAARVAKKPKALASRFTATCRQFRRSRLTSTAHSDSTLSQHDTGYTSAPPPTPSYTTGLLASRGDPNTTTSIEVCHWTKSHEITHDMTWVCAEATKDGTDTDILRIASCLNRANKHIYNLPNGFEATYPPGAVGYKEHYHQEGPRRNHPRGAMGLKRSTDADFPRWIPSPDGWVPVPKEPTHAYRFFPHPSPLRTMEVSELGLKPISANVTGRSPRRTRAMISRQLGKKGTATEADREEPRRHPAVAPWISQGLETVSEDEDMVVDGETSGGDEHQDSEDELSEKYSPTSQSSAEPHQDIEPKRAEAIKCQADPEGFSFHGRLQTKPIVFLPRSPRSVNLRSTLGTVVADDEDIETEGSKAFKCEAISRNFSFRGRFRTKPIVPLPRSRGCMDLRSMFGMFQEDNEEGEGEGEERVSKQKGIVEKPYDQNGQVHAWEGCGDPSDLLTNDDGYIPHGRLYSPDNQDEILIRRYEGDEQSECVADSFSIYSDDYVPKPDTSATFVGESTFTHHHDLFGRIEACNEDHVKLRPQTGTQLLDILEATNDEFDHDVNHVLFPCVRPALPNWVKYASQRTARMIDQGPHLVVFEEGPSSSSEASMITDVGKSVSDDKGVSREATPARDFGMFYFS